MFRLFIITTLLLVCTSLHAQSSDSTNKSSLHKEVCLLTGVGYSKHAVVDVGGAIIRTGTLGHHPFTFARFASTELQFGSKIVAGPKVGVWASGGVGGVAMGLNMVYYTDFDQATLVFRPEIGLGVSKFKLTYGYNARLTNTDFNRITKNMVEATYCFKLR